ncbi:hypothetical protein HMJ29_06320 [Hymenobacter taeanensis]|uniref:Uncharacterized protein n=1 Tax=Hymenobacter taeanensis TaxID=2735321 RepID=A0A6M6BF58_9BACT|nr:curli-like amyloid fiber formation chaperone CsgH [Hymenobacter taeanensis]QJX46572.1 hypothetical protein HMJ29_06320 [Hymenobacter taeanensis]UOQ80432.1 hypothetical protein MUN83_16635 [Hymenobacter sp. 5414T-23]
MTGHCRSLAAQAATYKYELLLLRRGPGGQSSNKQQGHFELKPGQTVTLSEVRLNLDERTSFVGQLRILDAAGQLVAQDSVRHVASRP